MKILNDLKAWFKSDPESPMGRFRMKEALAVSLSLLVLAAFMDKGMLLGWATQAVVQLSKAGVASFFFYWIVQRCVLHARTHELTEMEQYKRENVLVVCYAIIFACALSI